MEQCPVNYALTILNGKWKLRIVWALTNTGSIRFNELQRLLEGISPIMLSKSLQDLEENKIIVRKQFNEIPPHVEYSLSEIGIEIKSALDSLGEWGEKLHLANME